MDKYGLLGRLLLVDAPHFDPAEHALNQLKTQARRIETLSKEEHDLIKEVHPQVGELVEGMQEVVDSVRDNDESKPAPKHK